MLLPREILRHGEERKSVLLYGGATGQIDLWHKSCLEQNLRETFYKEIHLALRLPNLEDTIYRLEDTQNSDRYWLDLRSGRLREIEAEQLEAEPELLGTAVFPLAPWSSAQGYRLLTEFARTASAADSPDTELSKILRSRHQVFKRYRQYIKERPLLRERWQGYKTRYFARYLLSWYAKEFPEARELLLLLEQLVQQLVYKDTGTSNAGLAEQHSSYPEDETELSGDLLCEDFNLHSTVRETRQQFLQSNPTPNITMQHSMLRGFALLSRPDTEKPNDGDAAQSGLKTDRNFRVLCEFCETIPWLNCLAAQSPLGETVAALYWTWQYSFVSEAEIRQSGRPEPQACCILSSCDSGYRHLNLENYLLDALLHKIFPKLEIRSVDLYLDHEAELRFAHTLDDFARAGSEDRVPQSKHQTAQQTDIGRVCRLANFRSQAF